MRVPWDDPRLSVVHEDGGLFVAGHEGPRFDVILIVGPDPLGHAKKLVSEPFYQSCRRILSAEGVLATQSSSPYLWPREFVSVGRSLDCVFELVDPYCLPVPIYCNGYWSMTYASNRVRNDEAVVDRQAKISRETGYYDAAVHNSAFAKSNHILALLGDRSPESLAAHRGR